MQGDSNSPIIADNTGSIHIERLDNDVIEDVFDFAKLVNRNASEDLSELGGVLTGGFETALNASKSSDERNTQDLFKLMRLAVIIGGAAFVFSKMKFSK